MKKLLFKPLSVFTLSATLLIGCAGSGENSGNVETDLGTTEEPSAVLDSENLANDVAVDYDNLFENVDDTESQDLLSLARTEPGLSTFVDLVDLSGLSASFMVAGNEDQEFTLFIPTNQAFENLPADRLEYLRDPQNRSELVKVINAHILPNEVPLIGFESNQIITTAGENEIPVSTEMNGTQVFIGGAEIVKPDIEASNGIIHIVDGVIEPGEFTNVTPE